MSYTKGPWHVGKFNNTQYIKVYATNNDLEMICNVAQDKILHNKVQDFEANAKLIAASPDLLEAVQGLIYGIKMTIQFENPDEQHKYNEALRNAKASISKAVGV